MSTDDAVPSTRYEIVAGGDVGAEELAALTVALTPVVVDDGPGVATSNLSGWLKAALHEGVGGAPLTSADQVTGLR